MYTDTGGEGSDFNIYLQERWARKEGRNEGREERGKKRKEGGKEKKRRIKEKRKKIVK